MIGGRDYHQGDHVCAFYSSRAEQLEAAVEFIKAGLLHCERCIYVCCEHEAGDLRTALRRAGVHVETEEQRTALIILKKGEAHLAGGSFHPARMIDQLEAATRDALAAGFEGLCVSGDMSWLLDEAPGSDKLVQYEAQLNEFFQSHRALGLCLYDRRTLPPEVLDHSLATHAAVRANGARLVPNPFYERSDQAMFRSPRADRVQERIDQIVAAT